MSLCIYLQENFSKLEAELKSKTNQNEALLSKVQTDLQNNFQTYGCNGDRRMLRKRGTANFVWDCVF